MPAISDSTLYQYLVDLGTLDKLQLDAALAESTSGNGSLGEKLVSKDLLSEENLGKIIADIQHVPFVRLSTRAISEDVLKIVPESVAKKQFTIAFELTDKVLKVAVLDPNNHEIVQFLSQKVGLPVEVYLATRADIEKSFSLYQKDIKKNFDELLREKIDKAGLSTENDAPITELVNLIVQHAYDNRASDVHIEPGKDKSLVRFRIDGVLHDILDLPKELHDQIVSRIKVLARLKTDEHLAAQDGKLQITMLTEDLDIRVSVVPITKGEKVVMRLLSSKTRQFALTDLGMRDKDLALVKAAISKPFGMVLSTGPTGSGKTTSIYAIVKLINSRDVNIATIEDPVEYEITGINQIQVNPKTNLTFASGLRSILRQDPNVIFVGEIRDEETADIAINSATTGHLVLSTLHTNDAATALPRLLDMKIEPYLVASSVNVVIGQRLIRKICEKCRVSDEIDRQDVEKMIPATVAKRYFGSQEKIRVYHGKGCPVCHQTGFQERLGIFEVLVMSPEIRDLVTKKASADAIKETAVKLGMTTMLDDGMDKVIQGLTTLEEVIRATKE